MNLLSEFGNTSMSNISSERWNLTFPHLIALESEFGDMNLSLSREFGNTSASNISSRWWNQTELYPSMASPRTKLISDETMYYVNLILLGVTCACLSLFGIMTNILNIAVFYKQRFQDSATISYFALTVTDLCSLVTLLFSSICMGLGRILKQTRVDLISLQFVISAWTRTMFVDISVMITVFISVERALSVLMPMTFKHTFSKTKKKIVLTVIYVFGVACYVPVFATMGLSWQPVDGTNSTQLTLIYFGDRHHVELFNDIFNSLTLVTVSQIVVIASTITMSVGLLRASRFRLRNLNASISGHDSQNSQDKGPPMGNKDISIVQTIMLLSLVYVLCNLPMIGMIYAQLLVPALNVGGLYFNTILTLYGIVCVFAGINASVNFFIYYTQGSKFRAAFRALWTKK